MRRIAPIAMSAAVALLFVPSAALAGGSGHTLAGGGGHSLAGGGGHYCPKNPPEASEGTVYVLDNCFVPQEVTVETGEILTWDFAPDAKAKAPHTVTFEEGLDSGDLAGPLPIRFNQPGTYQYFCAYHGTVGSGMYGVVVVEGEATSSSAPALEAVDEDALGGSAVDEGTGSDEEASDLATMLAAASESGELALTLRLDPAVALLLVFVGLSLGLAASAMLQVRRR